MAKIELTTAPAVEPVLLNELQSHIRQTARNDELDVSLVEWEKVARKHVEETELRRALIDQTWTEYFDAFANPLTLRWPPLDSITSVKYIDVDGDLTTVATSVYEKGEINGIGIVRLQYEESWPTDIRGHPDSVQVAFVAGYGTAGSDVPSGIRRAIKVMVADMWEFPESIVLGTGFTKLPHAATVDALLAYYRVLGVA